MYENYLAHYGVKGMRWGQRKKLYKADLKRNLIAYTKESDRLEKKYRSDLKSAKTKEQKRAIKKQFGKANLNAAAKWDKQRIKMKNQHKKDKIAYKKERKKFTNEMSTPVKVLANLVTGPGSGTAYGAARASGLTKTGAAAMLLFTGSAGTASISYIRNRM